MSASSHAATLLGLSGAAMIGIGLFVIVVHPQMLRKLIGFNLLGAGVFLAFGVAAKRGAVAASGDPVPQALVITGIVVAFSATALAIALLRRLFELTGSTSLEPRPPEASSQSPNSQGT
jgi:multicomponent Na+:H+ antiporter subunit C